MKESTKGSFARNGFITVHACYNVGSPGSPEFSKSVMKVSKSISAPVVYDHAKNNWFPFLMRNSLSRRCTPEVSHDSNVRNYGYATRVLPPRSHAFQDISQIKTITE